MCVCGVYLLLFPLWMCRAEVVCVGGEEGGLEE